MSDEKKGPKKKRGSHRGTVVRFAAAVLLAACAVGLMELFKRFSDVLFPFYRQFSQLALNALSTATSFTSVAVWDIAAVAILAVILVAFVVHLVRRRGLLAWFSSVCVIVAALFFFMTAVWGLNHYAPPLSQDLELQMGECSSDELLDATQHYLDKAASLALDVPRSEDGNLERQDFEELAQIAGASYENLSDQYAVFNGSTQPVKELSVLGTFLLYTGHNGIISAFTGEASVPADCAVADEPFTMCHEAAHRCGIASEQEANFAAFLACSKNDDVRFRYAAYLKAFQYCYSSLAGNYPSRVSDLHVGASPDGYVAVAQDINASVDYYKQYEGALEEAGSKANDTYLKAFDEEEGIQSYGLVTDYLVAWISAHKD